MRMSASSGSSVRSSSRSSSRIASGSSSGVRHSSSQYASSGRYTAGSSRTTSRGSNQRGNEPLRSVSVSQVRDASRYRSRSAQSGRLKVILIVVALVAVVLGVGGAVLANSSILSVEEVTVSGVEHLTAEELTELAAVPEGSTLINIDANGIASRLTSNPWVESVTVDRVFPHGINLNITERSISAVVEVTVDESKNTERWVLSADGMWLMEIPDKDSDEGKALAEQIYEDADAALEITDIPYGSTPEAGSFCSNANIENALAIIDGMTTELADQVKSVSAASSDSTTLTLENGVEIAFGDASDIRDKERVCLELLSEYPDQISYINVRTVNNPVWRSL